jgi:hypothetical protein
MISVSKRTRASSETTRPLEPATFILQGAEMKSMMSQVDVIMAITNEGHAHWVGRAHFFVTHLSPSHFASFSFTLYIYINININK